MSLDKEALQSVIRKNGWSSVECGRAIRVLSVVDAYTRECLALEVDTSFASRRVTRVLDAIVAERGQPQAIRCDNGLELTSRHFLAWCVERQIELEHIQPGQPTQNARVESFHGRLREECLTVSWFQNLFDARRKIAAWKIEYDEEPKSARTAGWDTKLRKSLQRRRQRASTQLRERQGTQTPSLAPRAPPSRLKPERELNKVVVFLLERKQGEGHSFAWDPALCPGRNYSESELKDYSGDIVFVGGGDSDRVPYFAALVRAVFSVALYGTHWDRFAETRRLTRGQLPIAELPKGIPARIALCLVRRSNRDGHCMRTFEVPAVGGCMLKEDTEEHREILGREGSVSFISERWMR
jgi:hypothetical protein